ncbi:MAG TPA: hypothetical protein V6C65_34550 [Allocoleopsis sp.]
MFNKIKTELKPSIAETIQETKAAIDRQQMQLELLMHQQTELNLSILESQQQLDSSSHALEQLETQQAHEQQELEFDESIKELRSIADQINSLSKELCKAVVQFKEKAKLIKASSLGTGKIEIEDGFNERNLPNIAHQLGLQYFVATTRSGLSMHDSAGASSFWKDAQKAL